MASKRRMRKRGCLGKHRHATPEEAARHIYSLSFISAKQYSSYRCNACGFWHVGHAMLGKLSRKGYRWGA